MAKLSLKTGLLVKMADKKTQRRNRARVNVSTVIILENFGVNKSGIVLDSACQCVVFSCQFSLLVNVFNYFFCDSLGCCH